MSASCASLRLGLRCIFTFFEPVETFLVKLTILLTFRLSINCWKSTTITSWLTMQCN